MTTCKESINIYRNTREFAEFYQKLGLFPMPIPRVNGKPAKGPTSTGCRKLPHKVTRSMTSINPTISAFYWVDPTTLQTLTVILRWPSR